MTIVIYSRTNLDRCDILNNHIKLLFILRSCCHSYMSYAVINRNIKKLQLQKQKNNISRFITGFFQSQLYYVLTINNAFVLDVHEALSYLVISPR